VYATCSILPDENEDIVSAFMQAVPGFRPQHAGSILRAQGVPLDTGEWFKVSPHEHQMDGFFAAVLEREH
jgi:16S rRNA (cytosine967-C5)-methyltransferase